MKKILLLIVSVMLAIGSFAQKQRYYCEIKGIEKELSGGLKIVFDFDK